MTSRSKAGRTRAGETSDGAVARWRLVLTEVGTVRPDEAEHGQRLVDSP